MARTKFVILAHTRTGSTFLVSLLESHPEIKCHGELLGDREPPFPGKLKVIGEMDEAYHAPKYRQDNYEKFIADLWETSDDLVGFKLMAGQHTNAMLYTVMEPDVKIIYLHRDNILAAYSSELTAKASGKGHSKANSAVEQPKVPFVAKDFEKRCRIRSSRHELCQQLIKRCRKDVLELEYKDLSLPETRAAVLEYLGVDPGVELQSKHKQRNSSNIVSRFSNPDAAMKYLEKTGRHHWAIEGADS